MAKSKREGSAFWGLWGGRSLGSLEGRVWGWEWELFAYAPLIGAGRWELFAYAPLIGAGRCGAVGCLATVATLKVFSV